LLQQALARAEQVVVVLGSAGQARSPKTRSPGRSARR
jgi:nicotinamide mononucleotide adenylyltransferase